MSTTILNIWAGPGAGKSTTAAEVFCRLKKAGYVAELVTEYIKSWAWAGRKPGPYDDLYITAKQISRETALYGKVDYIVTDSPVGLGVIYASDAQRAIQLAMVQDVRRRALADGVRPVDCRLVRSKPYVAKGRYETEEQASLRDLDVVALLPSIAREWRVVRTADDVLAAAGVEGA